MLEELLSTLRDNVTNRESDKVRIIRLPFLVQALFSLVPDLKSQFLATAIGRLYEGVITTLSTAC